MKKLISICLVLLMTFSIVGCTSSAKPTGQDPTNITAKPNQGDKEDQTDVEQSPDVTSVPESKPESVSIEESILVDESGVKITVKSLDTEGFWGPALKLLIENESGKDLTVQVRNASVNGYMVDTMMSADVAKGKKANETLKFASSDLEQSGITTIADMEFSFHIFDSESWDTYLDTDKISIKTTAADNFVYSFDDSGNKVYDADGIKIVVKGLSADTSIWGPGVIVYIENTTEKDITIQARNVSVNGFMVDPIFSCDVCAGKHAIDTINFMDSDLEENEITEISDIELSFHVFDSSSWNGIVDTDAITIDF